MATAAATKSRFARRVPIPPRRASSAASGPGRCGASVPITESTVKEMIFGLIISKSDTSEAKMTDSTNQRMLPYRKCRSSFAFVSNFFISLIIITQEDTLENTDAARSCTGSLTRSGALHSARNDRGSAAAAGETII